MRILSFILLITSLILSGCSSPPPPTPFPKFPENNINSFINDNIQDQVIRNINEKGNWIVTKSIFLDSEGNIQSLNSDNVTISYLLDHADKITLKGEYQNIKRIQTIITFSHISVPIELEHVLSNTSIVNITFKKQTKSN